MCTSRPTGLCVTRGRGWHDNCISFLCRGGLAEMGWSGLERGVRCVVVGHAAAPRLRCHFHRRSCVCPGNRISDAGATALAEALKTNNTVQRVYLRGMSCVCSWCCVVLEAAPLRAHLFWTVDGGSAHGPRGFAGGAGRGVGRMPEGPSGSRGGGSVGRLQLKCVSHVCWSGTLFSGAIGGGEGVSLCGLSCRPRWEGAWVGNLQPLPCNHHVQPDKYHK